MPATRTIISPSISAALAKKAPPKRTATRPLSLAHAATRAAPKKKGTNPLPPLGGAPSTAWTSAGPVGQGKTDAPSLFEQAKEMVAGVPGGVAHFGVDIAKTAYAPVRIGWDIAHGGLEGDPNYSGFQQFFSHYSPAGNQIYQSMYNTADRWGLTEGKVDPLHALGEYKKASDEGHVLQPIVEDVANAAIAGGAASKLLGSTSKLAEVSAGESSLLEGGAAGRSVGAATVGARAPLAPLVEAAEPTVPRLVPALPSETYAIPGRGLAGLAERAGMPRLAGGLSRAGEITEKASTYGARVGNAPAEVYTGIPKLLGKGLAKVAPGVADYYPKALLTSAVNRVTQEGGAGPIGRSLWRRSEEGQRFGTFQADIERGVVDAERYAVLPGKIAHEAKLSVPEQNAPLFAVAQDIYPLVAQLEKVGTALTDDQISMAVDRMWQGVEPSMRPTPADVRTFMDWKAGKLDPSKAAAMNAVEQAQRNVNAWQTEITSDPTAWKKDPSTGVYNRVDRETGTGYPRPLNPEQLDESLRPSVVTREQNLVERTRDVATRKWDTVETRAIRDQRIANAYKAVNEELPAPPSATGERAAQKFDDRQSAMRREHARNQQEVAAAVDDYVRLVESDTAPAILHAAEKRLDKALDNAEILRTEIERRTRRVDAATALTRATGEFEPGARRTLDDGRVVDVSDDIRQPEVDVAGRPTGAAVRQRRDELKAKAVQDIGDELDRMTGGSRPALPPKKPGGEHDFWDKVDPETRRRLLAEGWFKKRREVSDPIGVGGKFGPDELAEQMVSEGLGRLEPSQAALAYIDRIKQLWQAKAGKGEQFINDIATELNLDPEAVSTALRGKIADYSGLLRSEPAQLMDDLRQGYLDLDPEMRQVFDDSTRAIDKSWDPSDVAEVLSGFFPEFDMRELGTQLVDTVDMHQLVEWVRSGDMPRSLRAVMDTRGSGQYLQLGRLEGAVTGAKDLAAATDTEARAAVASVETALRQGERVQAAAERRIVAAQEKVAGSAPVEGPVQPVRPTLDENGRVALNSKGNPIGRDRTWDRNHISGLSPGERARYNEGVAVERARNSQAQADRLRRSIDRSNQKIADMPTELARSIQERLVEVNRRGVSGLHSALSKGIDKLGSITGRGEGATLTGGVGRLADKYGVFDELLGELEQMRQDMKRAAGSGGAVTALDPEIGARNVASAFEAVLDRNGIRMEDWEHQRWDDSVGSAILREDMAAVMADQTGALSLNAPYRVHEVVNQSDWNMPAETRNLYDARWEQVQKQRGNLLNKALDVYAEAIPAPFRQVHFTAKRAVGAFTAIAEELNAKSAGSGDVFLDMAYDTASTLQNYVDAGLKPEHLTGGYERAGGVRTESVARSGVAGIRQRKLRAEQVKRTGLRELSAEAYSRVVADEARKMVYNQRDQWVTERFSRRADGVPATRSLIAERAARGETVPPRELAAAAKEAGWRPLGGGDSITPATPLLPDYVVRAMEPPKYTENALYKANRWVTSKWKTSVLGLSYKWLSGNVVGNVLMAWEYGGVNPLRLAQRMRAITKHEGGLGVMWEQEGVARGLPSELTTSGLTQGEYRVRWNGDVKEPRTFIGRFINRNYKINEFVDNLARSAVYLEKLGDGVPRDAALSSTLQAMGDFQRMSPFERNVVRQIFPFYAWMRHSFQATVRLPIYHPARAAFLYNLSNIYSDPDEVTNLMGLLSAGKLPLGGSDYLDIGSFSPQADINESQFGPFDPRSLGRSTGPLIHQAASQVLGLDLNTMERISRPGSTTGHGLYGQDVTTPSWTRLLSDPKHAVGEIGYQLTQSAPTSIKTARDMVLGGAPRYSGTGYELPDATNLTGNPRSVAGVLRGLNLPGPVTFDRQEVKRILKDKKRKDG